MLSSFKEENIFLAQEESVFTWADWSKQEKKRHTSVLIINIHIHTFVQFKGNSLF